MSGAWFDVYNYSQYGEKGNGGKKYVTDMKVFVKQERKE